MSYKLCIVARCVKKKKNAGSAWWDDASTATVPEWVIGRKDGRPEALQQGEGHK